MAEPQPEPQAQAQSAGSSRGALAVVVLCAVSLAVGLLVLNPARTSAAKRPVHREAEASPAAVGGDAPERATAAAAPASPPVVAEATPCPAQAPVVVAPAAPGSTQTCRWRFVRYHPSAWEKKWAANIAKYELKVCETLKTEFAEENSLYIKSLPKCVPNSNQKGKPRQCTATSPPAPHAEGYFPEHIFSKFEYALVCGANVDEVWKAPITDAMKRQFSYIEPLVGLLRHPGLCAAFEKEGETSARAHVTHMFEKDYMVVDGWAAHKDDAFIAPKERRSIRPGQMMSWYFDLGASFWNEGLGGASQDWFYETYKHYCIDFDRFNMWESGKSKGALGRIPAEVLPRYQWFPLPASPDKDSKYNPLNHVMAETTDDDFVMVKIDIDHPETELKLIEQIIESPTLHRRIDELYFEHHVNVEVLGYLWRIPPTFPDRLASSLRIFNALRMKGIRAHPWI